MSELDAVPEGIHEALITQRVANRIAATNAVLVERHGLNPAEAPDRIGLHLARQIERQLAAIDPKERLTAAQAIVSAVLSSLAPHDTHGLLDGEHLAGIPELLGQVRRQLPDGSTSSISYPLIPLLDSTLMTNSPGEPNVGSALKSEVDSADAIDIVMAFITVSGVVKIENELRQHCQRGKRLRVITTTYTGVTQQAALERLIELGAEVRVSYDTTSTRLHAKAWIFHRAEGLTTAYIGSSNLTHQAQVTGLEWNMRVSATRNPHVPEKMKAVFNTYWEDPEFRPYDAEEFARTVREPAGPSQIIAPISIHPLPFQARMLELLALERERGHHRNLLVSATGTGKTVMAALDYLELRESLPRHRLLFIAHRKEILEQSRAVFRQALLDASFGEMWVSGERPRSWEHVFASIQTLNLNDLERLPPDHFDVVIVDEFHHAAADSYQRILSHFDPLQLLGLTATPERTDGVSVLELFDGRISAELRLWDAINAGYLSPFAYYGIFDGTDLRNVPWKRGKGYDVEGLTNVYTADDFWAQRVIKEFIRRVDDPNKVRALGFCVSVEHALFMEMIFREHGLPARAVHGGTPAEERAAALAALRDGEIRIIFSVDVFNEGVDIPTVDTILMLRPTESSVIFLQQLGRGLRKHPNKAQCTVLDFMGHHHKEFRFDVRYGVLFAMSRKQIIEQVSSGFPMLPAGCHMELDRVATDIVLANLKSALPTRWSEQIVALREYATTTEKISLAGYLDYTGLELSDVYSGNNSFSDLIEAAGLPTAVAGPAEKSLRRAIGRMLHVDDTFRIDAWISLLANGSSLEGLSPSELRTARMLTSQLLTKIETHLLPKAATLEQGLALVSAHPQVVSELLDLLHLLASRTDHLVYPVTDKPHLPLRIHARYTRLEILSAFGHGEGATAASWQSGVFWIPDEKADLFAFTLDKSTGSFSPTTRYKDYAISPFLIHWESQAATRANSPTGRRYQTHVAGGSSVHLFARLNQFDRAFWYLGPAAYVSHESECPMAITWQLERALPGDLFTQFAAAVA